MRHIHCLSKCPERAQTNEICANISSDYQALLCFVIEALQTIFPSFAEFKAPTQTGA
ncbi:MAG: hypothetical protein L3K26_10675 [Candidatus Hydrogenedentes bacterium]|nr:hypothetical protein [Candidatus Hydrogenedentota bacterium]